VPNRMYTVAGLLENFSFTYQFLPVTASGESTGGWATGRA